MRGRKAIVPDSLQSQDFKNLIKKERCGRTRSRLLGLSLVREGKQFREVASLLKVHEKSVRNWVRKFAQSGIEGLKEQRGRGAKRKINQEREIAFEKALIAAGEKLKGGRLRGKDILHLMKEQFNVNCTLHTVYNTLKRIRFSWITARSQHPEANEEEQEAFKKILHKS